MSQVPPPSMPPAGYPSTPPPGAQKPQGLAIGALICGILSIVMFCFWFLSVPLGIVAIVLGVMAGKKARAGEASGEGMAKVGMILGVVGVVLSILLVILALAGVSWAERKAGEIEQEMRRIEQEQQQSEIVVPAEPTTTPAP